MTAERDRNPLDSALSHAVEQGAKKRGGPKMSASRRYPGFGEDRQEGQGPPTAQAPLSRDL